MRQAGRYLPEYRELRQKAGSFMNLCKDPYMAATVTLQPINRFELDAAILFSDILVIPEALGLELEFIENEGPKFNNYIRLDSDIDKLSLSGMLERLDYVFSAITNVQSQLSSKLPLIGFSGSPFTLACYMLEGGSSKNYLTTKKWLYDNPVYVHKLLNLLTEAVIQYLNHQIISGVDAVMIFDSWGGILSHNAYHQFSLPYINKIINSIHKLHNDRTIPCTIFTKGGVVWLESMAQTHAHCIGVDWSVDMGYAKKIIGTKAALQGNLDPSILSVATKSAIKEEVTKILHSYYTANNGNISGLVFNVGHGVLPSTIIDNVTYLINLVHEISNKYR